MTKVLERIDREVARKQETIEDWTQELERRRKDVERAAAQPASPDYASRVESESRRFREIYQLVAAHEETLRTLRFLRNKLAEDTSS